MPVIVYVDSAADCTVAQFMACKFENKYDVLAISGEPSLEQLSEAWEKIHVEFIDLSETLIPEVSLLKQIKVLECDIEMINCIVFVLEESVTRLGYPLEKAVNMIAQNGHHPKWNNDVDDYLKQCKKIRSKESKNISLLAIKNKELEDYRKAEAAKKTINNSRSEFIRVMNDLRRFGYPIDKDKTTAEELAIMIKTFNDEQKLAADAAKK